MKTRLLAVLMAGLTTTFSFAQDLPQVQKAQVWIPIQPYRPPDIAPIRMANSGRLYDLIRAGHLYLTADDAIALAIENNLDLEVDRYGPQLADWALQRANAGGPLRGVPSASAQVSSVNSGVGVAGSAASAGLGGSGGGGGVGGGGNATIQQVGAITPNLDPTLQATTTFSHLTTPQANTVQSQINAVVDSSRQYNGLLQQGLMTGGYFQYRNYEQYLNENAPSNVLNPTSAPRMDLILKQNLLSGFGTKLNSRGIRIAGVNVIAARESFRAQLLNLVASVLNLYWDYVAASDELKLRQHALELTNKFLEDTKYEISVGAIAGVELPRALAEVASRRQDVVIAEANMRQKALQLKDALSHREDPALEAADIVALDRVEVPDSETLPPMRELVSTAMAKRPDVAVAKFRAQTDEMNLIGTTNPLLPSLQVQLQTYNRGVAGTPQPSGGEASNYFIGSYGTALGQVFRRDFPNNIANVQFSAAIHNRQAQADYGIDQLQFRQSQVRDQKDRNQILVDVASQLSALQQARGRYETARDTRVLQEQLLAAERRRSYGPQTFTYIMADQRALITAQLSEMNAASSYVRVRIALDQVLGETLERNHITLDEGLKGKVDRASRPAEAP